LLALDENYLISLEAITTIENMEGPFTDTDVVAAIKKVKEFKKGKKGLMGLFVGEVMKLSKGKADPKMTNDILSEKLKS
jgi:aspartyl-tRNA(Asn)/glutamyl-tRNA(Gln) amidotransferase subunit B